MKTSAKFVAHTQSWQFGKLIFVGWFALLAGAWPSLASAQEKHALLIIGELRMNATQEQQAAGILTGKGYIVHALRPRSAAQVTAEISRLGAMSQDPNLPDWNRFAFFFSGHGGAGLMALYDENDKETGTLHTDLIARQIFDEIWADAYTYIFDMCDARMAIQKVWDGANNSTVDPTGWILLASADPSLGDEGNTYDEKFSKAIEQCLSTMGLAVNADVLEDCLTQERWFKPWWSKSLPGVSKIDLIQPDSVPVF